MKRSARFRACAIGRHANARPTRSPSVSREVRRRDRRRAVIDDGAKLILGPLLATEVQAVKPRARDAHLNIIAFSTVTELAGGNTFLMGFLPRQEVVREVGLAL